MESPYERLRNSQTLDIEAARTATGQAQPNSGNGETQPSNGLLRLGSERLTAGATSPIPATCSNPDGFGALNQQLQDLGGSIEALARIRHDRDAATRRLQTAEAAELKRKALIRNIVIAVILLVIVLIVVLVVL
ncbi:MAG: hypothetical protein IPF42_12045 [Candidatus Microthrix sp.]|nr:hypothetical protein [Candidatus Microthrix sp.]